MPAFTKSAAREIIDDFATEIKKSQRKTPKPSWDVINFRNELEIKRERLVMSVPIDILRFRKNNGRIASDVEDYETNIARLDEKSVSTQDILRDFLINKDPERTEVLKKTIMHAGQLEPAIITADGFLVNGNRRKMVLEILHGEYPGKDKFKYMDVVILPGKEDEGEGGAPTLLEIEQIENRYQLQSDGKSEYYGFDRALSIRRKIEIGFTLEEQLRDDPQFANATKVEIKKTVKAYQKDYMLPLAAVDRYLAQFGRTGQYKTISTGISDREGRWQAFIDYSQMYARIFKNPKNMIDYGIEDHEIGEIEEAAFDIIRLRVVPDMPKVHEIMRKLPSYCRTKDGKKAIQMIAQDVQPLLPSDETVDDNGHQLSIQDIDSKWAAKNKETIIYHIKQAEKRHEDLEKKETPITLLLSAHKKLTHENMDLGSIDIKDLDKARDWIVKIRDRADELDSQVYHFKKDLKKLEKIKR